MLDKMKNKKVSPSILVGIILILILVCSFVLFFEVNEYRNITKEEYDLYYYFSTDRTNFHGTVTKDVNDLVIDLQASNVTINSTPIYYQNNDKQMLLPKNMEIVYPYKNDPMYKTGRYSVLYQKNGNMYITSEAGKGRLYDCFLYDGEDLYTFIEDVTVVIQGQMYELPPMSFIEVTKGYVRLFNKQTNEFVFLENYTGHIEAYTEEYVINLSNDTVTYGNSYYILIKNVDGLEFVQL